MRLIDAEALLARIDEERKYLIERGQTGAEHILVHNFRDLVENAPTVKVLKDTRPQACLNCEYCCYSEMNEKGEILIKCNLGQGEKCLDGGKPE